MKGHAWPRSSHYHIPIIRKTGQMWWGKKKIEGCIKWGKGSQKWDHVMFTVHWFNILCCVHIWFGCLAFFNDLSHSGLYTLLASCMYIYIYTVPSCISTGALPPGSRSECENTYIHISLVTISAPSCQVRRSAPLHSILSFSILCLKWDESPCQRSSLAAALENNEIGSRYSTGSDSLATDEMQYS